MNFFPDTPSDIKIKECINNATSFSVIAGAGSGKTTSLVKALDYVRCQHGEQLRRSGQKVACITFTNRAVDVINERLNSDKLFWVSTLHSFLWGEIKSFQSDIREILKNNLIPALIEKKREDDNGGQSQKAKAARKKIEEFKSDILSLDDVDRFTYDETGGRNFPEGKLDHDDVVDLAALMIEERPLLRKIIGQRYPYIFVDEAQDTFTTVVNALNLIALGDKKPVVGYFGDPMQQIYEKRAGNFEGPDGAEVITKEENYRCSTEVIKLLNSFRSDLQQKPASDNHEGSVEIRLIQAEEGEGYRKAYSEAQLERVHQEFNTAILYFGWNADAEVKRLFLARQMIARRLGFPNLNKLFTGKYSSQNSKEHYESGKHYLLLPFFRLLVPLIRAYGEDDRFSVFKLLREQSPLLDPKGENKQCKIKDLTSKVEEAVNSLSNSWESATIREIFCLARDFKLIALSDRLNEQLNRPKRTEEYDEELYGKEKGDWLADEFLDMPTKEISAYIQFVNDETPFSTQHGVKGEEYEKVLVVFDDTEAGWYHYSFSKLLTPFTVGKEPTEGQKDRSKKLAYVCFSRAEKDLRIILFTLNPQAALDELISQGLFREDQISIQY